MEDPSITSALFPAETVQAPDPSYPPSTNVILSLLHDPVIFNSQKRGDEFIDELRTHIELDTLLDKATYRLQVAHRAQYKTLVASNAMQEVGRGHSAVDETLRKLTSETIESSIEPNENERATMERIRTEMRAAHRAAQVTEPVSNTQSVSATMPHDSSNEPFTIAAAVIRAASHNRDPIKLVGALSAKFSENSKFSGAGEPTLDDVLNRYSDAISEMKLTPTEQKQYCHFILTGEAKRFYDNHIRNIAATVVDI
jgi:hypothetical protein